MTSFNLWLAVSVQHSIESYAANTWKFERRKFIIGDKTLGGVRLREKKYHFHLGHHNKNSFVESQRIWQSMYDTWTTLVSYKQTNVVHENKLKIFFKNVTICGSHLTKNWTTFCLSIFIKVVSLERQKIGLTTSKMWTTLISCKRKNVVHEKV